MFFGLFKKKNKENAKIQELEQTKRELKHDQVLPEDKDELLFSDPNIMSRKEDTYYGKRTVVYKLSISILRDSIISIIRLFEKENAKMSRCHVSTYSDSGSCSNCTFRNLEDLKQLSDRDQFPSPYMTFYVDFSDPLTDEYQYNMRCSTNDDRVLIYFDPDKQNESK